MKLVRLLVAGKSLVAARHAAQRYRFERVPLPRFIQPPNPFAPPERVGAPANANASGASVCPDGGDSGRAAMSNASAAARRAWRGISGLKAWMQTLTRWLGVRRARGRGTNRRLDAVPVQRELSFGPVEVARNDLRDADVEVVIAGSVRPAGARWGVVGRAWERFSSRFTTQNQT